LKTGEGISFLWWYVYQTLFLLPARASSTRLQEVRVDVVSNRECGKAYRNVKATRNSTVMIIPQQLCAGNIGSGPKKDACQVNIVGAVLPIIIIFHSLILGDLQHYKLAHSFP
jgi:hypothetical protein